MATVFEEMSIIVFNNFVSGRCLGRFLVHDSLIDERSGERVINQARIWPASVPGRPSVFLLQLPVQVCA